MKMNYKKIYILILVTVFMSCQDTYDICDLPRGVTFKAGFYQEINGVASPANVPAFTLSLVNSSSSIYNNLQNIPRFGFALNPLVDSASYFIKLGANFPADTVTLVYSSQNLLISPECGNVYTHTLLRTKTTNNTIDSLKIVEQAINTTSMENLKIYF